MHTSKQIEEYLRSLFRSLGYKYLKSYNVQVRGENGRLLDFKKGGDDLTVTFQTDKTIEEGKETLLRYDLYD